MLLRKLSPLLLVMMFLAVSAKAEDFYATKTGANAGACTSSVHDQAWVQDAANWGLGAGKISPGDTLHLCGTWAYSAGSDGVRPATNAQAGTAGNPITIDATGADFQAPYFNVYAIQIGGSAYIVLNGGTYENTNNGSAAGGYMYQHNDGRGIYAQTCDNCEIKNTTVRNFYVHTSPADHCCVLIGITYSGVNFSIHDNTLHDNGVELNLVDSGYGMAPGGYQIYRNNFSNYNWGMDCGSNAGTISSISVHDNRFGGNANWDTDNDSFHKNGMHCYSTPPKKIQNIYIYNNLVDGDWGNCCVTSLGFFLEASDTPWGDATSTAFIYNNLFVPSHFGGDVNNGYISVGTGNGNLIANNTIIGVNRATGTAIAVSPCCGAPNPTNMIQENNVIEGATTLIYNNGTGSGGSGAPTLSALNFNTYGNSTSNDGWVFNGTHYLTFAAWKAACGCDASSTASLGGPLANLSSAGVPNSMFAGVGAGTNLSSIATGALAPLASDAAGTLRPTGSTSWTTGAYQLNSGPIASFSPSSVVFGNQVVSTSSSPSAITLTNAGTTALNVSAVSITGTNSGDFSQTNNCVGSIAAGNSCTINATFAPLATGARSASVSVTDTAPGSPHTVPLTGTGTAPAVTIAPPSVAFGNQAVGSSSSPAAITVTNSGTSTLTISSVTLTGSNPGDFSETDNCVGMIAAGMSCTVNATFTPTTTGARSVSVSVADNASGSPHTAPLTGTGTTPGASLAPGSLAFGSILVGASAGPQVLTLSNTGGATLTISSITLTGSNPGDFSRTTTCGGTLTAGSNCTISVTFTPTTTGARSASVSVADSAVGSPQTSTLSGTGTSLTPPITPASTAIILASVPSGTVGIPYPATAFSCIGGSPPCSGWSMIPLVPGLTLSATAGVLGGTPTMAGNFAPAITAKDAAGKSVSITLSLPISQATAPAAGTPGAPGKTPATMSCVRTAGTNTYTCKVLTYK